MISPRALLSPLLTSVLLISLAATAHAAPAPASQKHAMVRNNKVVIAITTTSGTVWGKVSLRYTSRGHTAKKSCSTSSCTFQVPHGDKLHLTQSATDTATWPFEKWQIKVGHNQRDLMGTSASVKVKGNMAITAVYILRQSTSASPQPTQPGYTYMP